MTDALGPAARALIDRAVQEEYRPSPDELANIHRRILAAAPAVAALTVAGKAAAAAAAAGNQVAAAAAALGKSTVITWLLGGFVLGAGAMTGVDWLAKSDSVGSTPVAVRAAQDPNATAGPRARGVPQANAPAKQPSDPAAEGREDPLPQGHEAQSTRKRETLAEMPARVSGRGAAAESASAPQPASSLNAELTVLERVRAHLRDGRGNAALQLIDKSPQSQAFANERLVAEVLAACQAGQQQRARQAAAQLFARAPRSPLARRVHASCAVAKSDQ